MQIISKKGITSFIGNKIKKYRELFEYTQEELAKLVGITPSYLGNIERGEREPSLRLLEKIAEIFDIDSAYFFSTKKEKLSKEYILRNKILGKLKNNSYQKNLKIYKLLKNLDKL